MKTQPRHMYDSDIATDIPANAKAAAGYVDGASNYTAVVKHTPHAQHLPITIHGDMSAHAFDSERGALTVERAVACAKQRIHDGHKYPWLYYSVSMRPAINAELKKQGLKTHQVIHWGAHYGEPDIVPPGYDALQNTAVGYGSTGHWDRSVLRPFIPGFDTRTKTRHIRTIIRYLRHRIHSLRHRL